LPYVVGLALSMIGDDARVAPIDEAEQVVICAR
jgi:hypothetical protein